MNSPIILNLSAGALGAFFTFAFGYWTEALTFLFVVIAVDIISGAAASLQEGKGLSSAAASVGLAKKGLMLLVIVVAHRAEVLIGSNFVMGGAIYFYIANELLSITENYGRAGLPLPDMIKRLVAMLHEENNRVDAAILTSTSTTPNLAKKREQPPTPPPGQ